jgi:hypothetical protein
VKKDIVAKKYYYKGYVLSFGKIISKNFTAESMAVSKAQAIVNIQFQFKKANNLAVYTNIELDRTAIKESVAR